MEASRFSSSKESAPYIMCCECDVHCGVWHWWDNTAHTVPPRQTVNAAYYCKFLYHLPPALRRKRRHLVVENLSFFMIMQGVLPLLSQTSSAPGNGRFWNIHPTHPKWVHAIMISSPKWKNHCDGSGITQEMNLSELQWGHTEHQQRWTRWWCTTSSKHLAKGDK